MSIKRMGHVPQIKNEMKSIGFGAKRTSTTCVTSLGWTTWALVLVLTASATRRRDWRTCRGTRSCWPHSWKTRPGVRMTSRGWQGSTCSGSSARSSRYEINGGWQP
ncbi:uncharacterized protein LOC124789037 [Schistocerca piceifrons]|uniref:uncharacterized protein LOC124789037 n=1 Tax=Schistocerca piceifrons TaxID=274613 RepID=UPI001F5F767C|nr:uncharacterized protein LOC124789037 [Schistocerca piceifrons]